MAKPTQAPEVAATQRGRAKADRRASLLAEAARLFAARGFDGVSIEDLGAAAGVSGPAVYRHFPSKQGVLAALLVGVSESLRDGGAAVVADAPDDVAALRGLVRFHVDFALGDPDVIRVQDRDLDALAVDDRRAVRALQRAYVELWVGVLARLAPDADPAELRLRAQATFGLLNSTPHSVRSLPRRRVAPLLEEMALAALGHPTGS
ncbi:TetR/AcrR family transcriptional regulator [Actinotalea ferrariae]|uniref:SACE_7040 family transcriptional regulator n=1 Tax=Actinotalea ferrariae TaxID=1386098 RepID=UPI001C8B5F36|nr:TetR/AcrR family transcriptional regulator [Actinotalea ferrariae]MBX9245208.1 TetR/AcrR family transcriptional regulator [Actinotalea ferrariae]